MPTALWNREPIDRDEISNHMCVREIQPQSEKESPENDAHVKRSKSLRRVACLVRVELTHHRTDVGSPKPGADGD